jgi:hypothetical protein
MLTKSPSLFVVIVLTIVLDVVLFFTWGKWDIFAVFGGTAFIVWSMTLYAWINDQVTTQAWRGQHRDDASYFIDALSRLDVYGKMILTMYLGLPEEEVESTYQESVRIERETARNRDGLNYQQVSELLVGMKPGDQLPAQNGNPRRDELARLAKWLIDKGLATGGPNTATILSKPRREILEEFRREIQTTA